MPNSPSLHQLRLRQNAVYLREAEEILADWDLYSDLHSDLGGWPLDDVAYGLRKCQRGADTWRAFRPLLHDGHHLLGGAEAQLTQLPAGEQTKRWRHQLTWLRECLAGLHALASEWEATRQALPPTARPGTKAYDEPLAERNAEAWTYLDGWADQGQAPIDIDAAAEQATPPPAHPTPAPSLESPQAPNTPQRRGR